jgi:outer membrane lipoprotein SlyB
MRSAADHQSSTEGSTLVQTGKVINRRDNTVTLRLDDGNERAYGIEADSTVGIGDRVKIITHAGGVRITH